jgi:hypothetical protein
LRCLPATSGTCEQELAYSWQYHFLVSWLLMGASSAHHWAQMSLYNVVSGQVGFAGEVDSTVNARHWKHHCRHNWQVKQCHCNLKL